MAACARVRKRPIIALYFDFENKHKFFNLGARVALSFSISNDKSCLPSIGSHSNTTYSFTSSSDTSLHSVGSLGAASSPKPTVFKVSKGAKIRNRYNQVPHLTQDTNGKVTNSQQTPQTRAKRSALFPAGDHKAHINRRAQRHSKHKTEQKHKRSTKEVPPNSNRKKPLRNLVINFQSLRKKAGALTY